MVLGINMYTMNIGIFILFGKYAKPNRHSLYYFTLYIMMYVIIFVAVR